MTEYTPDEQHMEVAWIEYGDAATDINEAEAEFDRFLAHVRRDAWQEGYDHAQAVHCDAIQPCDVTTPNPYEAERDEWREASAKRAASSSQANADLYEAEARIKAVRDVLDSDAVSPGEEPLIHVSHIRRALDGDA